MKRTSLLWVAAVTVGAGCLQDYDSFEFGEGGTPNTGGAGPTSTAGPGSSNTTGAGSPTSSGQTTTGSGPTTAVSTGASTAMSSSTGGTGPFIECGGETCDVSLNQVCCVDSPGSASCEVGGCSGNDVPVECDEQADCPGEICCVFETGGSPDSIECSPTCDGQSQDPICMGSGDPICMTPTMCVQSPDLPSGYEYCQSS